MTKLPLDLSKFRKVKSDAKTSTFQHHEGHQITIAHNKLSSKLKDQLSKIPLAKQAPQKFAEGGTSEVVNDPNVAGYNPQTPAPVADNPNDAPAPGSPAAAQYVADTTRGPDRMPAQAPQDQMTANPATPAEQPTSAPAQSTPAPEQAAAPIEPEQQAASSKQIATNAINADDPKLTSELQSGKITPETYHDLFAKKDTLGKISSIFGLLVGGLGSGLTRSENPVSAMWDNEIKNDLAAQEKNIGNKNTLLSLTQQGAKDKADIAHMQLTDRQSQVDFAHRQANIIALHHLVQQAATLDPNTPAGQKAQQGLALVGQYVNEQNANLADQIASRKAFQDSLTNSQGNGNDPAKALRMKQIQGILTPEQYTQGNKEIAAGGEAEKLRGDLQSSYNDLNNSVLAGKFSPEDRKSAINAFAGRLAKISEGRFNLDESKMQIESIMPAAFESAQTRQNKLQRLNQLIDGQVNTPTLNGLGIQIPKQQNSQAAPQYKTVGGVKYMRGPNGQAIPVK